MRAKRLIWYLYPGYLATALAAVFLSGAYALRVLDRFHLAQRQEQLASGALFLQTHFDPGLVTDPARRAEAQALCRRLGAATGTRLTLIAADGAVAGDSERDPAGMDNHADRPEVQQAFAGGTGRSTRFSDTLRERVVYVALPVLSGGRAVGVLRTAAPLRRIGNATASVRRRVLTGALVTAVLVTLVTIAVSRRIARPLAALRAAAERIAGGELAVRAPVAGPEETAAVAGAFNDMAAQLEDRIRSVVRQRGELEAVLGSMDEGVLAVNGDEHVVSCNRAAARLLGIDAEQARGRMLQEVVRHPELHDMARRAAGSAEPVEDTLVLAAGGGDTHLHVHATALREAGGAAAGVLLVLHDVTRLTRLEGVRREFVANVSHELKTPVTSIRGYVEALQDGGGAEAGQRERFLAVVARQAARLEAIIDDLLSLSRLEADGGARQADLAEHPLRPVLAAAVESCALAAEQRRTRIAVACPADLVARLQPALLEHAVANLVDNAVKYGAPGAEVLVEAGRTVDGETRIRVADHGCGIERKHLDRVFDRFYRVDKARSRAEGGTGLGLAIVKHVALVHGGRVGVESEPGRGSTFSLFLPANPPSAPAA